MSESEQPNMSSAMLRRLRDDASVENYERWCATDGARLNRLLGVNLPYDKQRAMFTLPRSTELRDILANSTDPDVTQEMKDGDCDWDSVVKARDACIAAMDEGKKEYEAKGDKSPFRRLARRGGDTYATMLMPLLEMIPDEMGLRFVRSGLVAIFNIVKQRAENREKILSTFENIPLLFFEAIEARKAFPSDLSLVAEVQAMYEALLQDIPKLTNALLRKHGGLFHANDAQGIDDVTQHLTHISKSLHLHIEAAHRRVDSETHHTTETIRQTTNENKYWIHQLWNQNVHNAELLEDLKQALKENSKRIVELANPVVLSIVKTSIYNISVETEYMRETQHLSFSPRTEPTPGTPQARATATKLFWHLNIPAFGAMEDLECVLRDGNRIERGALAQSRWLLSDSKFISWVSQRQSNVLLVEAHCSGDGYGKSSPLSVCYATLALAVAQMAQTVSLHYFCGQHISVSDPVYGPSGLIRSLILQLLIQYPGNSELAPNLDFIDNDANFFQEICSHDIPALCDLFHLLIRQIEREDTTISCIIDNISLLEGVSNTQDAVLKSMFRALLAITTDSSVRAKFKMLIGCENRSTVVVGLIPETKQITLRTAAARSDMMSLASIQSGIAEILPPGT
ncbi:hypothetical protein QBC47DRAFT_336789 [Echria macrotheca]|uniref:Nephrocystin 3-like N-terminal domain-containing protein n=1 Tax=Echria macrotheca TaxID=438768 RepID=A0AAJ0BIX1_9PEZI|nr:hypothetical protein QBC47DRAFT_336789 [Echria macrotheca]